MQQIAYYYISNLMASSDDKKELMKTFLALDLNNDGKISRDELIKGFHKVKDFQTEDVDSIIAKFDTDGSGAIDYSGKLISFQSLWQPPSTKRKS